MIKKVGLPISVTRCSVTFNLSMGSINRVIKHSPVACHIDFYNLHPSKQKGSLFSAYFRNETSDRDWTILSLNDSTYEQGTNGLLLYFGSSIYVNRSLTVFESSQVATIAIFSEISLRQRVPKKNL